MKNIIDDINKAFESRVRLGVMSILSVEEQTDFKTLKEQLGVTDGNLASHLSALEKLGYLAVIKKFIGKKPNTSYTITKIGQKAFNEHINALEYLLKNSNK